MAPDAGGPLAEAYVTILPDMSAFVAELAAKLDAATKSLHPTVKVTVEVDTAETDAKVAASQGLVDRFGKTISTAKLQADDRDALVKIAESTAAARKFAGSYVGKLELDNAGMIAQAASQTAWMDNLKKVLPGNTGIAGGILDSMAIKDSILSRGQPGESGGASPAGQVADAATKGLLSKLLWPKSGGVFGVGAGLAAAGSLGSLAGFGPEHLLTTGVGLAGSAVGAGLGAGLLGAGALGVAGVGMGTDLAGIGQASGDIKATYASMTALNTAVAAYGPNTSQAVAGQTAFNTTLAGFSPVAQGAVTQAANAAIGLHALFNSVSGQAEKTGAEIITSFMGVAQQYIPTVGKYATENMSIIQEKIKPLLSWLSSGSGGLGIFTELEKKFQSDLPTAVHAGTQAVEFFGKSLGFLSNYTGGFMQTLDRLFTRLNSPEGFSRAETVMAHLIADFHTWDNFIKVLVTDIALLFKADAGTAQSILGSLTAMLLKFQEWERSTAGQQRLTSIFTQHRDQILALLQILPDLLRLLSPISAIMPLMVAATIPFIDAIAKLLGFIERLPFGVGPAVSALLGLALVFGKLVGFKEVGTAIGAIVTALKGLSVAGVESSIQGVITKIGVMAGATATVKTGAEGAAIGQAMMGSSATVMAGEETIATGATVGLGAAMKALLVSVGPIAGVVAVAAGAYMLWNKVMADTTAAADGFVHKLDIGNSTTMPELKSNLADINKQLADTQGLNNVNGGGIMGFIYSLGGSATPKNKALSDLNKELQQTKTQMTDLTDNTTLLADHFGISRDQVDKLASSLGINLTQSMNPTTMIKFKQGLDSVTNASQMNAKALSQVASQTGFSMAQIADASAQAASAMVTTMQTSNNLITGVANATTAVASVSSQQISAFYSSQIQKNQQFTDGIKQAMSEGFSPAVISQILTAGVSALPTLQGLLQGAAGNVNGTFVQMVNNAQQAMTQATNIAVEEARLMNVATQYKGPKGTQVSMDYSSAVDITTSSLNSVSGNGIKVSQAFINGFQGGLPALQRVMSEYGLTITNLGALQATAAANAQGKAFLDAWAKLTPQARAAATRAAQASGQGAGSQGPTFHDAGSKAGLLFTGGIDQHKGAASASGKGIMTAAQLATSANPGAFLLSGAKNIQSHIDGMNSKKGAAGNKGKEVGQHAADQSGTADAKPAGVKVVNGIIDGIDATKGKLNTKLYDVVKGAENYVIPLAGGQAVGKAVINGVGQGLQEAAGPLGGILLGAVKQAIGYARDNAGGQSIGVAIANGIAQGIGNSSAVLAAAGANAANKAIAAAAGPAGANNGSPSKKARDLVGLPIAQGIAAGLTGGPATDALTAAAVKSINTTLMGLGLRPAGGGSLSPATHPVAPAAGGPTTNSTIQNNYINMGASSATAGDMVSALSHALRTAAV